MTSHEPGRRRAGRALHVLLLLLAATAAPLAAQPATQEAT
jgi:hypothetical protein